MNILWLGLCVSVSSTWVVYYPTTTPESTVASTGTLTDEQKKELKKAWGVDPDQRKQRLNAVNAKKTPPALTEQQKQQLKMKRDEIPVVVTERPADNPPLDLFEVNEKSGIGEYLYSGDVHLSETQLTHLESQTSRKKRQVDRLAKRWTNNTVYYFLDASITDRKRRSLVAALSSLQASTCINFEENPTATNRVRVFSGTGCYSNVGMVGGQQDLSLGNGCEVIGTVAHEFTHALGVWHMQMRSDRDNHVTIDASVVIGSKTGNFAKLADGDMVDPSYTPYEYGSFMHYAANSFSRDTRNLSIIPNDTRHAYTLGNQMISFYDLKMINDHYRCGENCPQETSALCQNGGIPNPRNCSICNCPYGYAGPLCDQRPSGCGSILQANETWQTLNVNVGNGSDTSTRDVFTLCNHWIQAPEGAKIEARLTYMYNPQCGYGCPFNGIEFKVDLDKRTTNPRYCCPEFYNQIFTSNLNKMPIITYNRYYVSTFTLQYRAILPETTTTTTSTIPPVTKPRPPSGNKCMNTLSEVQCSGNVAEGFCNRTQEYNFQKRKYNCAQSCGLCGQAASPCIDLNSGCYRSLCISMPPMDAEFWCAKTCGYCDYPN